MSVAKRRKQAVNRRRWVTELAHRHEDRRFYEHGTIPPSALAASLCSCGARAFTRDPDDMLSDFADAHAYCDEVSA
jgi:hypothetical protein